MARALACSGNQHPHLNPVPCLSVHRIVISKIHQHDAVILDEKLDGDSIGQIDRNGMKTLKLPA